MTALLEGIIAFLLIYKYSALFVVALVAAFAFPLPASTMLVAAGAFSFQGYFSLPFVFAIALLGNVLGDAFGYILSQKYGRDVLRRIGLGRLLDIAEFQMLEGYIQEHFRPIIFWSRFMTSIGPSVNVLSGLSRVPYGGYFLYEFLGEALYVFLYSSFGYYLGSQWEDSMSFLITLGTFITLVGLLAFIARARFFHNKKRIPYHGQ